MLFSGKDCIRAALLFINTTKFTSDFGCKKAQDDISQSSTHRPAGRQARASRQARGQAGGQARRRERAARPAGQQAGRQAEGSQGQAGRQAAGRQGGPKNEMWTVLRLLQQCVAWSSCITETLSTKGRQTTLEAEIPATKRYKRRNHIRLTIAAEQGVQ